jgi:hypothetical protein
MATGTNVLRVTQPNNSDIHSTAMLLMGLGGYWALGIPYDSSSLSGFGPTNTDGDDPGTGFYSGITPSTGNYTTYQVKNPDVNGPSIRLIPESNIVSFLYTNISDPIPETNAYGRAFTSQSFASQQILAFPRDVESIYVEGLQAYVDASMPLCYASGSGRGMVITGRRKGDVNAWWRTFLTPYGTGAGSGYKRYHPNDALKNVIDGSMTFNSADDEYFEILVLTSSPLRETFTQQFLVYVDGSQSNGRLFSKPEQSEGDDDGYEVYLDGLEIVITVAGETISSGVPVNNNSWNFINITITDTQNKISINNGSVTTNTRTTATDLSDIITSSYPFLGGSGATAGTHFNGKMAVFLHYLGELTAEQKTQNWNIFKDRFGL